MVKELNGYWVPDGLTLEDLRLSPGGLSRDGRDKVMNCLHTSMETLGDDFVGFQATQKQDFRNLSDYLAVSVNNIGDPFSVRPDTPESPPPDGYFQMNSKCLERAVLDYYATLWNAEAPYLTKEDTDDRGKWLESYWGYVVSMGSTEGNLLALRNARDYLKGVRLQFDTRSAADFLRDMDPVISGATETVLRFMEYLVPEEDSTPEFTPVFFYSEAAHYSIKKITKILEIKTFQDIGRKLGDCPVTDDGQWPAMVPTDADGAMDIGKLENLVDFFAKKKYPVMICFNYGTTWTGAYDNVEEACKRLIPILKKHGMYERTLEWPGDDKKSTRKGFWFHVDGALGAGYVPFLKMLPKEVFDSSVFPEFDFNQEIASISMSGHKWMGAPWPCGLFMTKNKFRITNDVPSYVGSLDSTLAGSRNGFSAILFWDYLSRRSHADLAREAKNAQALAARAYEALNELYPGRVDRAPGSLAIRFPRPDIRLVKKYSLSSMGNQSHIFIMKNITEENLEKLLADLREQGPVKATVSDGWEDIREILQQGW
ncbi:MAG: pyridoxal-dependent decarboxylase [Desulfobacterales bacterium]|nr:pyridoxal-dependent decarboxylase [Desulfobacterales bacterium]